MITVIAEKPSVARDIAHIVGATNRKEGYIEGNGYLVTWAIGHLITLAMPEVYGYKEYREDDLPIIPNPFQLMVRQVRKEKEYMSDPAALKQLKAIRFCFDKSERIIVATDAGREGELIFRYIYDYLHCQKPFDRLWISSLTDKAITEGLSNLKKGTAYNALYRAAKARSEADWLVGINASRALSIACRGGYSLGRVQTPTLAMVCKRFVEHRDFKRTPFWKVTACLSHSAMMIKAVNSKSFETEAIAQSTLATLGEIGSLTVVSVLRKVTETPPPLLYDLTALQKEANKRHGFSADKTLCLAQSLYEKKVTTYPRTGSRYISEDVFEEVPALLASLKKEIASPLNRNSVDNSKVTDHHAIIITGESRDSVELSKDEGIIYEMIVARFLEAFSPNSKEERMQVTFTDGKHEYVWQAQQPLSLGWKAILREKDELSKEEVAVSMLPTIEEGETLPLQGSSLTTHQTKPKPLYTEATLLSAMEYAGREVADSENRKAMAECGIGTPATRANIIETLILRDYIRREKKALVPTDKGLGVYEIVKNMKIADAEMTGSWEVALAAIEADKMDSHSFSKGIEVYTTQICKELLTCSRPQKEYPIYKCPKCGKESFAIYNKVAKCKDEACEFKLFRLICQKQLSEKELLALIKTGESPLLKGLKSKSGNSFDAYLVLKDDGTTAFKFPPKKNSRSSK